ncbi:hypothetical protein BDM02DRAFT_3186381 [Thelephora ganbajun]|uniref:Uncharacterized protein n=1 Tax=Thelephora ganbajun TaxID=370292 RepID=A0ACB6ZI61_THEGA|nr:hypothetical protein BDM02DRAFT_3186381 [Thelephora ganbajun]
MDTGPDMSTYLGVDMTQILGPLFWGTLVSMIFTGITIVQAYHYFPSKDQLVVQLVALSMLVLDLLSSALAAQGINYYLLPHFGSTVPLGHLVPTLAVECVATTFIIAISQAYFAWQVYALAQKSFAKYVISGAVLVLSLLAFAGGLGCSVVMFVHPGSILATRNHVFNTMAGIAKVPAALADIIATSYLCYTLGYARTGIKATDSVLKTLIGFSIQRGVLVTLVQVVFLIMFYASAPHLYWLGLHVNVTRVYANTFFAMLNGRDMLKRELQRKSIITSGFGTHNQTRLGNTFQVSKKESDRESGIEVPQSVWMDTFKGGNSVDTLGAARIQVDQKVVVSNI